MTLKPLALFTALLLACPAKAAETRTWSSIDGKKIEASIVRATDQEVVLKMSKDGKEYTLPINRLSVVDGTYINRWLENQTAKGDEATTQTNSENWDAPWPTLISGNVSPEIETVEENEEKRQFVYRSPHYEYVCDVKLTQNVVRRFAILFEATNDFMRALPLSMEKAHRKKRHLIYLYETFESYDSFLANANTNYGIAVLITYYFFHWDGQEDAANIKAFLKALKAGKTGEDALAVLLAGRTYDQLEEDIAKAWRARGIKLEFQ